MIENLGVVAVVPFWSQAANLNADSNYSYLRVVLPEMERQTTNAIFLVLFPDPKHGSSNWKFTPDGLQSDRIRFIPWPCDTQMATGVVDFDVMRWKQIEREYGPTIYWLHRVEIGANIVRGYERSYNRSGQPTLVAQHHYIIHKSLPYPIMSQFPRLWAQMGGSIASEHVVYNSAHCKRMADESFGDFLSPSIMDELELKSTVLKFGLLSGDEPAAPVGTVEDEPIFLYNHRFEHYKHPERTFEIFDELRDRFDFKVWATQTAGQKTGGRKRFFYDRSIFEPSRAAYLELIASVPAINTINSAHETFCIALLDSIAAGHIVVAPNSVTFPELVPAGYPYLFDTVNQQRAMLEKILTTWSDEYNRWREPLRNHAMNNFDLTAYVRDYLGLIQQQELIHRVDVAKDTTVELFAQLFDTMEKGKQYAPRELRNALNRMGYNAGMQAFPVRRIVREAMNRRVDVNLVWNRGVRLVKV